MKFRKVWPCRGTGSFCAERIYAYGVITSDTPAKLKALLDKQPNKIPYISFNSPGGDLAAAMKIGEIIRKYNIDVLQEQEYREVQGNDEPIIAENAICASACLFALVGGRERLIHGGVIGVRQFAGSTSDLGESAAQYIGITLAGYLQKMGVSREVLDLASAVPPSQMYWLSEAQIKQFGIDNTTKINSDWEMLSTNNGRIYTRSSIEFSNTGAQKDGFLDLYFSGTNGAIEMTLVINFGSANSDRTSFAKSLLKQYNPIITFDNGQSFNTGPLSWRQLSNNAYSANLIINRSVVSALQLNKNFNIDFLFPNVLSDLNPSSTFEIGNLKNHLYAFSR